MVHPVLWAISEGLNEPQLGQQVHFRIEEIPKGRAALPRHNLATPELHLPLFLPVQTRVQAAHCVAEVRRVYCDWNCCFQGQWFRLQLVCSDQGRIIPLLLLQFGILWHLLLSKELYLVLKLFFKISFGLASAFLNFGRRKNFGFFDSLFSQLAETAESDGGFCCYELKPGVLLAVRVVESDCLVGGEDQHRGLRMAEDKDSRRLCRGIVQVKC